MTRDDFIICAKLYTPNLLRYARRVAGNAMQAEDIVQECFEVLWMNREKVEKASAKPFLFSVAHKKIIDTFRSDMMMEPIETVSVNLASKPENLDQEQLVHLAISHLSPIYKELIILRDLEAYSYKEIEEITRLSESQVRVYLFRARNAIKEKILELETI